MQHLDAITSNKDIKKIKARLFLLMLSLLFLLPACTFKSPLESNITTYKDRLLNVLNVSSADLTVSDDFAASFPARTSMLVDVPQIDMNLREFYGIENCPIKQLIAQRNTALGKIHLPSQRFKYEVEVINTLQTCYQRLVNDAKRDASLAKEKALIGEWLSSKKASYDANWANLITQSEEIYLSLNNPATILNGDDSDSLNAALIDLNYLLSLNNEASSNLVNNQDLTNLEAHLQSMQQHRFYSRLWKSMELVDSEMALLNTILIAYLPEFQCHSVSNKAKFDILRNVFSKYFIQGVQPIASALNNYQYQLQPLIKRLSEHPDLPQTLKKELKNKNETRFSIYQQTLKNHIDIWQQFFARCSVSPQDIQTQ